MSLFSTCKKLARTLICCGVLVTPLVAQYLLLGTGATPITAGSYTLLQTSPAGATTECADATTCAVTLVSSIAANDLLTLQCATVNAVEITSMDVGGTANTVYSGQIGNGNSIYSAQAWVYPSSATAGPVTLTFSATTGGAVCKIREYSVSAGTPKLDWAHGTVSSATQTFNGETPTLSGTNDLLTQTASGQTSFFTLSQATSVSVYGDGVFSGANLGTGFADLLNSTSTTPPSWGSSSASTAFSLTNGMAFATNATACNDEGFIAFNGASSGTTITPALANAETKGYPTTGGYPAGSVGWFGSTSPLSSMTYQSQTPPALHTPVRPCGSGASTSGTTASAVEYNFAGTVEYLGFTMSAGGHVSSYGAFVRTTYPASDTNNHDTSGIGSLTNNFVTLQTVGNTSAPAFQIECNGGSGTTNFSSKVNVVSGNWYWATVQNNDAVGGAFTLYETSGWTSIGSGTCTASGWTVHVADTFQVGQGGGSTDFPTAVIDYANVRWNLHGTYPLTP